MKPIQTQLGQIANFYNGAEVSFTDDGEYIVYGSNGPIGKSRNFNNEDAIIMGRVGAYCGSIEIGKSKFWASDNTIVVKPKSDNNLEYLYYLLINTPLRSYAGGAAQPLLTHTILRPINLKFFREPIYQILIADILSAYNELIANNRKRIQLLEESARLLFREWFVYFRFPRHEKGKMVNGVPEGWRKEKLSKIGYLNYGKSLVEETREEGDVKVYGSSGVVGVHSKYLVEGPGIIVGRKGNVGAIHWVNDSYWPIDTVYYIKREQSNLFLYLSLKTIGFINTDASVPGLNRDYAHNKTILVPTKDLLDKFLNQVNDIYNMVKILTNQNQKLAQARDLLLPRLMSGTIEV